MGNRYWLTEFSTQEMKFVQQIFTDEYNQLTGQKNREKVHFDNFP